VIDIKCSKCQTKNRAQDQRCIECDEEKQTTISKAFATTKKEIISKSNAAMETTEDHGAMKQQWNPKVSLCVLLSFLSTFLFSE
jgi:hypothetical protein